MRILIIQTAFLGDVILITPMLRELKNAIPNAEIDVLVRKGNESLLGNNPHLSKLFVWDKKRKFASLFENLCLSAPMHPAPLPEILKTQCNSLLTT
jgi:heptosyltransferase-2